MNPEKLERYIEAVYGAAGERLFARDPATCVFRHQSNRKWFAVIMEIPGEKLGLQNVGSISVVNVKCDPRLIGSFRLEQGIFPAYHMSKAHWLTVALDGTVPEDKLQFLLEMSYDLTK
ncbi:MAG: MmcQ/YjbR family DNA-binding protein [Ruminococcaceae bacterium]|nr:MmcQ/YjbR family DNA-binding protein [Oscillospiraceae bacterium]